MKVNVCLICAVLAICAGVVQQADAALEMVSTNTIDIGQVYNYASSTNTFIFANKGKADIAILDVVSTCPCIQVVKKPQMLRPGETYILETQFNARTVHGRFMRGAWLVTDDPARPRALVKITGEVLPLFEGIPKQQIVLKASAEATSFTNELIFIATTTNFFLCEPLHNSSTQKSVIATLKRDANKYQLTTVIRPDRNMQSALVSLPVEGPVPIDPIQINFKITAGAQLRASPGKLIVPTLNKRFTKTFYINTQTSDCTPDKLTWTPQIEGLEVKKTIYSGTPRQKAADAGTLRTDHKTITNTRYSCTLTISPEALSKLMQMEEHVIMFHFPDHKPVKVELVSIDP
jgi:hypothetical protein